MIYNVDSQFYYPKPQKYQSLETSSLIEDDMKFVQQPHVPVYQQDQQFIMVGIPPQQPYMSRPSFDKQQ